MGKVPAWGLARGEVSFSTAEAVKPAGAVPAVSLAVFHGEGAAQAEIARVCDGVAAALAADDDSSIAILGRSRSQLQGFVDALRARGVSGLHLATAVQNTGAQAFYTRLGFAALPSHEGVRAYALSL